MTSALLHALNDMRIPCEPSASDSQASVHSNTCRKLGHSISGTLRKSLGRSTRGWMTGRAARSVIAVVLDPLVRWRAPINLVLKSP